MKKNVVIGVVAIVVVVGVVAAVMMHSSNKSMNSKKTANVAAVNNAVLKTKTNSSVGQFLTTPSGQPLYMYNADSNGVSNCTGSCLAAWPAYQDTGSTVGLPQGVSTIKRTDNGQIQFTYNGKPLYTFASDTNGTETGNGVSNFSVAKPAAASNASSTTNASAANSQTQSQSSTSGSSNYPY